ncbi:non-ribosomal peptide synthetase [Flavobacterium sp. 7A]|uniref:non-ribosomal peptide synthetase n=1 Tax=Flavobacterium sp. 7A TaxID=2940571 RepID=UPI002227D4BD|nr:amino acid adenylation domain-containing protein [Flavobacterium sp. 7A]MCW2121112.1 amino acid adenylation domain-containing protein [Flavobacterium sp. 7A]
MIDTITKFDPFAGPEIERVLYTTKAQSEIWSACYFGGQDAARAYNESITIELQGSLDLPAMELAIQNLIKRHEALRASFSTDGVYMTIYSYAPIEISTNDLSNLSEEEKRQAVEDYTSSDAHFIFDLVNGPLIKIGIVKLSGTKHNLVITAHHIICDGWSIGIMLQDLGLLYSAYSEHITPNLPDAIPFSTYADEELLFEVSNENKETEAFWHAVYKDTIPVVDLPTDHPRPSLRTYKSKRLDFALDPSLLLKLQQTARSNGASFVTTLLASFEIFMYQLTNQEDLVIGLPSAGQPVVGMNHLMGHCVNLLPLRSKINANISFTDYLKGRKSELLDAYDHSQLTFGHLLQKLNVARDPSQIPLVPVVFNIDMGMTRGVHFSNLTYNLISNPRAYEAFELFVNASGDDKNLIVEWSYNASLFESETIEKMMLSFEKIIRKIVENPTETIGEIIFQDFSTAYLALNNTASNYPDITLFDLIKVQANQTPTNVAIAFSNINITYARLNKEINQMSHYFRELGVAHGNFVAVSMPRSPDLIITLLAITQCGAAYIPLDHEYPLARLQFMMEDSQAKFLVTTSDLATKLPQLAVTILIEDALTVLPNYPDTALNNQVIPNDIAYVLYTSGSTGKPKGVCVTHKNLVNFLFSMSKKPGITENDRLLSITTISFDIAGLELYLPLINGATLVLADHNQARDGRLLLPLLEDKNITILQATPTTWQMLMEAGWEKPLPIKALCGGEPLSNELARKLVQKCDSVWNVYGPTETTIWSSLKQIKNADEDITIGTPVANTQIYIIDERGQLAAPGKIGEIAIAGDGVAQGYWNRPELTAEKFVVNPFSNNTGSLLYLTGDLGKMLPNNEIICLGRNDQQVKIRGHRIDPGEIEQALLALEGIKYVVVLANENFLNAHIVPDTSLAIAKEKIPSWHKQLSSQLPSHLVPHAFILLTEFPTTLNGKIDRTALLQFKEEQNSSKQFTAPTSTMEILVADVWKECLQLDQIDIHSNFFEIGGHSLVAVKVMSKLEKTTKERLPLSALFEYSTIEKLALLLTKDKSAISWDSLVPIKPNGTKTPLYIVHGAGLNVLIFNALAKNLDNDQPVFALQAKGLNGIDEPYDTIEEIAAYYIDCIMKNNPNGPYALAGYSFGGIIAYEMAHQFSLKGKKITMVGLLDTNVNPQYYYSDPFEKKMAKLINKFKNHVWVLGTMLTNWEQMKERFDTKLNEFKNIKNKIFSQSNESQNNQQKLDDANAIASNKYHLVPRAYKLDLFRVNAKYIYRHNRRTLGWKRVALKGVEVHDIPGSHFELFAPPHDKISARIIQDVLDLRNASL